MFNLFAYTFASTVKQFPHYLKKKCLRILPLHMLSAVRLFAFSLHMISIANSNIKIIDHF